MTKPPPPKCMAKALAAYWRAHGMEGHRVDEHDKIMAEWIWKAMLKEGHIEDRVDTGAPCYLQAYVIMLDGSCFTEGEGPYA